MCDILLLFYITTMILIKKGYTIMKLSEIAYLRRKHYKLQTEADKLGGTLKYEFSRGPYRRVNRETPWDVIVYHLLYDIEKFDYFNNWQVRIRMIKTAICEDEEIEDVDSDKWEIEEVIKQENLTKDCWKSKWYPLSIELKTFVTVPIKELIEQARNAGVLAYYDKKEKMLTFKV